MSQEKQMITDTLQQLGENMELFYQQKPAEALNMFQEMLGKLVTVVDTLFAYREENDTFVLDEEKLKNSLTEAMNALDEGDLILLADVIQYDFIEYVQELTDQME